MFIETPASKKSLAFRKPVFGRGVIDVDYVTHTKHGICPHFIRWRNMLDRCYNSSPTTRNNSYANCEVCSEWLSLNAFKKWIISQDWHNKHLDKDLLVKGNKVYRPDRCLLIDKELNMFLSNISNYKGYTKAKNRKKKYRVQISVNGKNNYVDSFYTKEEAIECYKDAKRKLIQEWANKYKLDNIIYNALIRLKDSL